MTHEELELVVQNNIDTIENYPLGETSAMKWAIAWRLIRDKNKIDANGGVDTDIDGWMVGWFANCMASAPEVVKMRREESEQFLNNFDEETPLAHIAVKDGDSEDPTTWGIVDDLSTLLIKINHWGYDRNIIGGATSQAQMLKLVEEEAELFEGISRIDDYLVKDGIGDAVVVMAMIAGIEAIQLPSDFDYGVYNLLDSSQLSNLLMIETGKLSAAVARSDSQKIEKSLDALLHILSAMAKAWGSTLRDCVQTAYDEIKDRKGVLYEGVFIKSTDIQAYTKAMNALGKTIE